MKIKTSSLAVAAAVLLTFCMVFMAPVGAVGSVTVNGETTTYENLTAAANAATAVDSKITYTISGDVEYTAGVSLVKDGATEIIIVGDGYSTSSLTIIGPYHLGYSANGATISFSGLNLTDNRNIGESDAWHFRYIMIDANSVSFTNCLFTEGLLLKLLLGKILLAILLLDIPTERALHNRLIQCQHLRHHGRHRIINIFVFLLIKLISGV